jgi:DNA/RNA-binding domain of Phe-tRNA-synthetase-like protein
MKITIDEQVRALVPDIALGILTYQAEVKPAAADQVLAFDEKCREIASDMTTEDVGKMKHNAASRAAYKALGKDPSKYRPAAEAMLRRIIKGKGLYHINNVVDVNNLVSIESGYSIGSYLTEELAGDIVLVRADDEATYPGIGKSDVHISHLPTLKDELGYFGNPTSDSQRAMVTEGSHRIMSVVYAFDGSARLGEWLATFADYLRWYCFVDSVDTRIIQ